MSIPVRGQLINRSHPLARGLLGIWPTNNCSGEILMDASGNGLNGIRNPSYTWPSWSPGITGNQKIGEMLFFNNSHLISTDTAKRQPLTANSSMLLWSIMPSTASPNFDCPFNIRSSGSTTTLMGLFYQAGYIHWWCGGGSGNNAGDAPDDMLHCWVITHDDTGEGKLYLNGELFHSVSGKTWGALGSVIHIWGNYVALTYPFTGYLGLSALWNKRTLSANDVKLLYREPYCMFDKGIIVPTLFISEGQTLSGTGTVSTSFSMTGLAKVTQKALGTVTSTFSVTGTGTVIEPTGEVKPDLKPCRGSVLNKTHPLSRGIIGCWLMNEGTGTKVNDLSGNGITLDFSGDVVWAAGNAGYCLDLPGDQDYLDASDVTKLMSTSGGTFVAFFKADMPGDATTGYLIGARTFNTSDRITMNVNSSGVFEVGFGDDYTAISSSVTVGGDGKWHVGAVTWDSDGCEGFLDGVSIGTYNYSLPSVPDPCGIGAWPLSPQYEYDGLVDRVYFYSRKMSAAEMQQLWQRPSCIFESRRPIIIDIVEVEGSGTVATSFSVTGSGTIVRGGTGTVAAAFSMTGSAKVTQKASGTVAIETTMTGAGTLAGLVEGTGTVAASFSMTGSAKVTQKASGTVAVETTVTGAGTVSRIEEGTGTIAASFSMTGSGKLIRAASGTVAVTVTFSGAGTILAYYEDIPPFMEQDLIDPYSGGAWLWLVEIAVPTFATKRIARNTEDVVYGEDTFDKFNINIGEQMFSGDGSIPRVTLQIFQDINRTIEDIVNEAEGALGGNAKLIRVCDKFLSTPVAALEADYDILASESDTEWVTFTIGIPNPLTQRIPLRIYESDSCPYATPTLFKGPECQYTGSDTSCTGNYDDCYTKGNAVHFGGELGLDQNAI